MDKYIGFDMACKKTVACVVQQGKKDAYRTLKTDVQQMQAYLQELGKDGSRLHRCVSSTLRQFLF
jgi:hypothetical protein